MENLQRNYSEMFKSYPDIVNVEQLQEMIGICANSAYSLVKKGIIKSKKVGKMYKIPKINVIAYMCN